MLFSPSSDLFKVPASVFGVEVDVCFRGSLVPPHLTQNTDVDGAHELLADDVKAVSL